MPLSSTRKKRAVCAAPPSPAACATSAASFAISSRLSLPPWNSAACSRVALSRRAEMGARPLERRDHLVVDRILDHQRVLRRAGGRVVEALGARDLGRGIGEIGALLDDHRDVAGAHPDRRRAAAVGLAHVGLAAGADHEIDRLHQGLGARAVDRLRQDLHQIRRQPDLGEAGPHQLDRPRGRSPARGRGRDHDRVAALDRHHRLVDRRRRRVGGRRDRADHADGLGVFHDALRVILLDHANGPDPEQVAQRAKGLALVLHDLVGDVAEAGVGDRERR